MDAPAELLRPVHDSTPVAIPVLVTHPSSLPPPSSSSSPGFASAPQDPYKQAIAQAFGQAHQTYAQQATAQQASAQILLQFFDRCLAQVTKAQSSESGFIPVPKDPILLPQGPILEIGCGTGFLTQGLLEQYSHHHPLEITDLSPAMVAECQRQMAQVPAAPASSTPIEFYPLDGEAIPANAGPYALIISNFAVQWFQQPRLSQMRLLQLLKPGGWLVVAFPSCQSFPEWRSHCEALGQPFPAQHLPAPESWSRPAEAEEGAIAPRASFYETHDLPLSFDNALAFLRHFKTIGAASSLAGANVQNTSTQNRPTQNRLTQNKPRPTPRQVRQLIQRWDKHSPQGLRDSYQAVYVAIQT